MTSGSHLFLSYNSRDRDKVREIHRYLNDCGVATFFDQQNLRAGSNWPQALEQALRNANAVAVFVGAQVGNWQWPEIGFSLDRQANENLFPVIPVLLDGADTSRSFLFLNTWIDLRGERLTDPGALAQLKEAVTSPELVIAAHQIDINPYRGLEFFDEEHAPFFFGREAFSDALFDRLTNQRKTFVAVIGASGSGKSSVVRAGLIPKLRRRRPPHETWDVAVLTPGDQPWFRVASAVAPLRFPDKADTELDIEIGKIAEALRTGTLHLRDILDRILQFQGKLHRLLLVVDQFEELFTLTQAKDRTTFIEQLVACLDVQGVVLVPTLRADFYGQAIEADRRLSDRLGAEQITLGRLTQQELRRAIDEPARLTQLEFDPGLPELLLRDAGNEPGNLPLLQHALLELYEKGKSARRLTSKAYEEIGGIHRSIANSAEREYQRLAEQGKGQSVRQVFTQLVRLARVDEGIEDTRRRISIVGLPSGARTIVEEFASYRLRLLVKARERVVSDVQPTDRPAETNEQETVEVAHEALIREWDRLKGWLNEDRGFYLWRQRLDLAIEDREKGGDLLTGAALKEAEGKLAAPMPEALSARQKEFVKASIDARDRSLRKEQAREEEQRREYEDLLVDNAIEADNARASAEFAKQVSVVAAVVLLVIAGFAVFKFLDAERQRKTVVAQTLVLRANSHSSEQYVRATLLTALALRIQPTQGAKDSAIALVGGHEFRGRPLRGHLQPVTSVAISRDGTRIVSGSEDMTVRLWDAKSGQPAGVLRGHGGLVWSVAFSSDGTRIVSGSTDKTLRLWDAKSGAPIGKPLRGHEMSIRSVAFSFDGTRIVSGSEDTELRLWDAKTGQPIGEPLRGHDQPIISVAFSPDGTRIVSGSTDNTLRLWTAGSRLPYREPLRGHEKAVTSVAFSPDGTRIVSGSTDNTLRLWDAATGQPVREPLLGHRNAVTSVAFSPDGTRIVSGSQDTTLRLWDAKSGQPAGVLRGHGGLVWSVAFSFDGTRIVSGSEDTTLRLWDAMSDRPIGKPLRGHEHEVTSVAFSPDGARIVSGSEDTTLRLWDAKTGQPIGEPLRGHEESVQSVAFSPDGTRIVSGSGDMTLRLWDAKDGHLIGKPLRGHEQSVTSVAFSPDGTRIVSGSIDSKLRLWDVKTDQPIGGPLGEHEARVASLAFSRDGTRIVSGSWDKTLRLWNAESDQPVGEPLRGHEEPVTSVAISPDGTRIVSGSWDGTLRLWNAKDGHLIGEPLRGHEKDVSSVAFSPDGTRIVSGSWDETLRLWNAKSGKPVGEPLHGHQGLVVSVAFSPDGTRIASGSGDMTLRLWDARLLESGEQLHELLCETLHRNLTCEEWTADVPEGEEYQAVCEDLPIERCPGD